jgi:hypothetical protein
MKRRPETIARTREMVTDRGCVESGIYSAKENSQARRYYVTDGLAFGREQLLLSWLPGLSQE